MSDDHPLKDDVGFLKRLARSGQGEPAPLAWLLALFGFIYGSGCLLQAGLIEIVQKNVLSVSQFNAIMVPVGYASHLIFIAAVIGAGVQTWATRDQRPKVNRIAAAAWAAALIGLLVTIASLILFDLSLARGLRKFAMGRPMYPPLLNLVVIPSIMLALYGGAWFVAAAATGRKWLWLVSAGSFAAALAWAASMYDYRMMLVVPGLALLLLAFVPGLILALSARRKVVAP